MILVDSSAWIEYQRATCSPADNRLTAAVQAGEELATTGFVLQEVLAGARDEDHARELRCMLNRCTFLRVQEPPDNEAAAALYRTCRRQGETIRRLQDCLIAAIAIRTGAQLLHQDADFDRLARHTSLAIVPLPSAASTDPPSAGEPESPTA